MAMHDDNPCSSSRRSFLRGCGLTLTGFGVSSLFPGAFMRHAMAAGTGDERLIFIFLRGGNDGINSVIPHGDPQYNLTTRKSLYIPPAEAVDLNGFASLHPAMAGLTDAYNAGDLAVIHRAGYPSSSQSHFIGQRIWENGSPGQSGLFEGWLARYIHEQAAEFAGDIPAMSVQPETPILLRGKDTFLNITDAAGFYEIPGLEQAKTINAWRKTYDELDDLKPYRPILSQAGVRLMDSLGVYESWDQANWNPKDPDNPTWSLFPVNSATNPLDPSGPQGRKFSSGAYSFFTNLKITALSLLESGGTSNGTRVAGTELQGFDTHIREGSTNGRHAELLSWLAYGIRSLRIVLSGAALDPRAYSSIWNKTVVVTMSEFGRTSATNGNNGTDHAAASCMWVAGGNLTGGVYNCDSTTWPAGVMFGLDGRYLLYRTDFRAIFWEILRDHMGALPANVETIFPGYGAGNLASQELGLI
jgi:uncharacterized protein (DUF1501 family)